VPSKDFNVKSGTAVPALMFGMWFILSDVWGQELRN
jgi:hypothetical protein